MPLRNKKREPKWLPFCLGLENASGRKAATQEADHAKQAAADQGQ
jgi:hypothetical protein